MILYETQYLFRVNYIDFPSRIRGFPIGSSRKSRKAIPVCRLRRSWCEPAERGPLFPSGASKAPRGGGAAASPGNKTKQ